MANAIEFRVLGPVEAARDGQVLPLGGRRQRVLLALLLLEVGATVSSDRLIDELWQGSPPPSAETTLRAYVSRLRSALGENVIAARALGYALEVGSERLDATRFERLLRDGREALARGAAGAAANRLAAALALWQGPALSDVAQDGALALEAKRLDELRLDCREERIEAELGLGRHAELVPELEHLVAEQPLRERVWRQLVTALYRCERQADALATYQRARAVLSEELGLEPSDELRALERAVLRHEVAVVSAPEQMHNLPVQATRFFGREGELDSLQRLLRDHRLLTLTGMGGAGKTRLALEVAASQVGAWPDGVWLVELMPLSDPSLVPTTVARALRIADRPDIPALDGLVEQLRTRELLLVLDNCEHLIAACAALVDALLRGCTDVRVLATSRLPLAVAGELDYAVEPLRTPTDAMPSEEIEEFASVQLFLDRGRAARRDLPTSDDALGAIGAICREVDGLPLAIELAAARAKALSVHEIAGRLDDRLRFLRSWRAVTDPRHQTLRATIDWSYDLLSEAERELLAGLSVFAGGFTLEAAAEVCLEGDENQALELVSRLVESSLVVAEERHGRTRYRLLETIREYSAERLEASGATEALRRAHAEHFLEHANRVRPNFVRFSAEKQQEGLAFFEAECDNLHAAMRWALAAAGDVALELAAALRIYWNIRGYNRQGLEWLEQALSLPGENAPERRAEVAAGAALFARLAGDLARARRHAETAISLGRRADAPVAVSTGLNVLVTLTAIEDDFRRTRTLAAESAAVGRAAGSPRIEAMAFFVLADAAVNGAKYAEAREAAARALELGRAMDDPEVTALSLARLGLAAAHEGRLDDARDDLLAAFEQARDLGFTAIGAWCCAGLSLVAAAWGDAARAARLLGAEETLRRASGYSLRPAEAAARASALAAIRETLAENEIEDELERGRQLSLVDVVADARGLARSSSEQGSHNR